VGAARHGWAADKAYWEVDAAALIASAPLQPRSAQTGRGFSLENKPNRCLALIILTILKRNLGDDQKFILGGAMKVEQHREDQPNPPSFQEVLPRWLISIAGILFIILLIFGSYWYFLVLGEIEQQKAAKQEWRLAASRHYFIAQAISRCYTEIDLTVSTLPDNAITTSPIINAAFLLGLQPNGTYEFGSGSSGAPPGFKPLSSYHNALIHLSDGVAGYRVRFATNVARQRSRMDLAVWAIAIIGAIATILISVKSVLNHQAHGYTAIGIFAIVFSAIGTSASSLNSFYAPYDKYTRSEQALLQLRHLHYDINDYIARRINDKQCKDDQDLEPQSAHAREIKDYSDRFGEILNGLSNSGAVESAAQPDSSSPSH